MGRPSTPVRFLAILAAVVAAVACAAASAGAAPFGYVTSAATVPPSVSIFDTATDETVGKPIPVGETPDTLAITPNGRTAYVANRFGNSVSVIDIATAANVKTIEVGTQPIGVAISPDGSLVYVSDYKSEKVSIISTATNTVVGELKVEGQPAPPAVTPDGRFIWVPHQGKSGGGGAGGTEIFDARTRQPVGSIETPEESFGLVFTPDGGKALLVAEEAQDEIWVIDTATRLPVKKIPVGTEPQEIAVAPSGRTAYASISGEETLLPINLATNEKSAPIKVAGSNLGKVAITPDGKTAYVADEASGNLLPVDLVAGRQETGKVALPGNPTFVVIAPDQSPTAAFTAPSATAGIAALFNGAASSDPDGRVAAWSWAFGDGGAASGPTVTHTFGAPGTFAAKLSVTDNEGCGAEVVFTGQTAYCSGNVAAAVTHPVTVATAPILCSAGRFAIGRIVHNRHNGTARVQVKVPTSGSIFLFGNKVHAVTKKSVRAGTAWLTLHARVKLNKRLKQTHRARIRIRVNFFPATACGAPANLHRSLALLRAPKKKHRHR
jgi:YVTN family beta-propeller protein